MDTRSEHLFLVDMPSMEEIRDEWDAHDEDVKMSRSCEPNSHNFFANEDGESKEMAQKGRRGKLKRIWEEGPCPCKFDQTWWDALVTYWTSSCSLIKSDKMRIVQSKMKVISCTGQAGHVGAKARLVNNLNYIINFIVSMYKWEVQLVMYVVVGLTWVHIGRKKIVILHYLNCMVNKPMTKVFNLIQIMYTLPKSKIEYM